MNSTVISRRRFTTLLGLGAVTAALRPPITLAREQANASAPATGHIRLSANENPYGPSPKALKAMSDSFAVACRYPDEHANPLIEAIAKLHNVDPQLVLLGDGSSEILKLAAVTFTGPEAGNLVVAEPTFEAIVAYAQDNRAEVAKVPLTSSFAHDLAPMSAAAKQGLIYICNPNNPTASITPKQQLQEFIASTPPTTMLLVDEAYFHFAESPDYESVIPLIKDHPNLLVARTFSKIYGMAGLRCGYCVGQKDAIERMRPHQQFDSVNCLALAGAHASLADPAQVENGRKLNSEVKAFTVRELEKMGYKSIPSEANFIMFDTGRPVVPLIAAMKQRNIEVGRLFPAMPNYMRLTIGKKSEMEAFLNAFHSVAA